MILEPIPRAMYSWVVLATGGLLAFSALRHELFNSTVFDLGVFDQAAYLISQGLSPFSSYMGYHILGDHAALVWYPIGLLYWLWPTVYWLLGLQALALAGGALPAFRLGQQAGLSRSLAMAVAIAYLLYPVVFNANLFDFHTDVLAIPLLLQALVEARRPPGDRKALGRFLLCLVGVLTCKAVLSLTVVGVGLWLAVVARRWRWAGLAIAMGLLWFWVASQWIVPGFSGREAAAVGRYAYLGNSVLDILKNLVTQPQRILGVVLSGANAGYLLLVFAPIAWALSRPGAVMLVGALPCLALNLLADYESQKDVIHHYTLPALPFFVLMGVTTLAQGRGWVRSRRAIVIWAMIGFLALAKFTYAGERYWPTLDTWQASRGAIAQVKASDRVLATTELASHVSQRVQIQVISDGQPPDWSAYDVVLLNARHARVQASLETIQGLLKQLQEGQPQAQGLAFTQVYQVSDVYVFRRQ
jgi:uncharacterized membrane protein